MLFNYENTDIYIINININIQELKQYIESAVDCGTLTMPKEDEKGFSLSVPKENELFVIDTKEVVRISSTKVIDEWIQSVGSDANEYIARIRELLILKASNDNSNSDSEENDYKDEKKGKDIDDTLIVNDVRKEFEKLLDEVPDSGLILKDWLVIKHLFKKFDSEVASLKRKHGKNSLFMSFNGFEAFLSMIYIRRRERIRYWLKSNTDKFDEKEDRDRIDRFINESNSLISSLDVKLTLCGNECGHGGCKQLCLLPRYHESDHISDHDCYHLTHKCGERCDYCIEDVSGSEKKKEDGRKYIEKCGYPAGHSGKHNCLTDKDHSCGKSCYLSQYGNCKHKCCKPSGHDIKDKNDKCQCDADYHSCGKECHGTNCNEKCRKSYTKEHERCDCGSNICLVKCEVMCGDPMKEMQDPLRKDSKDCLRVPCGQPCQCKNHFHQLDIEQKTIKQGNIAFHCCMKEHFCGYLCQENGNCSIKTQRIPKIKTYISNGGETFKYEAWNTTANAHRKRCSIKIPIGKKSHDGGHSCNSNSHTCDKRCPLCLYFCDLEYGHNGLHRLDNHGNMVNTVFVSDAVKFSVKHSKIHSTFSNENENEDSKKEEFDSIQNEIALLRNYVRRDSGSAEMCHNFCISRGRGHVHTMICEKYPNAQNYSQVEMDGILCARQLGNKPIRRHAPPNKYGDNVNNIDEVTHDAYWQLLGFQDPVKDPTSIRKFQKCKHFCSSKQHEKEAMVKQQQGNDIDLDEERSYCIKPLWHAPVIHADNLTQSVTKGHLFNCKHKNPPHMYVYTVRIVSSKRCVKLSFA